MKIIFLDIDGVLNNVESHRLPHTMNRKWMLRIDERNLPPLQWLLEKSGAQIVMSSSLRGGYDPEQWTQCWRELGVPSATVCGITPRLEEEQNGLSLGVPRGREIGRWVNNHSLFFDIESFVILDDSDDMERLSSRLVLTDYRVGLTMADAEKALRTLSRPHAFKMDPVESRGQS